MTILQMRGTDEETNQPPQKKRRLSSRLESEGSRQSIQAWLRGVNNENRAGRYQMPAAPDTMVNDYDTFQQSHIQRSPDENSYNDDVSPIASLLNLGNTCFLNSVLYTLRFAPSFLHKLHHLNSDSEAFTKQLNANKQDKAYSLGRNLGKAGSWGNKDSFSSSTSGSELKTQKAINKLHQLYSSLYVNELKDRMDPFQPNFFLHALRDVNPIFEGNQQHDAHELLVCLLDIIREVCELLYQQSNIIERSPPPCSTSSSTSTLKTVMRKSLKFGKMIRSDKRVVSLRENHSEGDIKKYLTNGDATNREDVNLMFSEDRYNMSQNTLFEDFRGVSLLRTTCLECEQVTERKETFCDICVPIRTIGIEQYDDEDLVNDLYRSIIVTEEYLIESNKYWCERCLRYNEARRCVKYERLPRLLTLQLKRFSTYGTSVAKINEHMPTPFTLPCFCEDCLKIERVEERPHSYSLYAIIMHIGATIASGHYVAFVKTNDNAQDYILCSRDKPKTTSLSRGSSISSVSTNASNGMMDKSTTGLSKYLTKLSSKSFNGSSRNPNSKEHELRNRITPTCKGLDCCTVRIRCASNADNDPSTVWLECDDETVRVLPPQEMADILSPLSSTNAALTPYLLFYARVDS